MGDWIGDSALGARDMVGGIKIKGDLLGLVRIRIILSPPSARSVESGRVFLQGDFYWIFCKLGIEGSSWGGNSG
jgi:hypothetical protein